MCIWQKRWWLHRGTESILDEKQKIIILVPPLGGVVLGRHDKTSPLPRAFVHGLDDVDHLLLVGHGPADLVVVTSAEIDHDVLVAEEEHGRAGIVELVRL